MALRVLGICLFSFSLHAQNGSSFKDLRTYYEACGLVGRDDPRFTACNPPNITQIMEEFKKNPKNVQDMKKIARFHMTHSLQKEARESLKALYGEMKNGRKNLDKLKEIWSKNQYFIITFSPQCKIKNSLELGQKLKNYSDRKMSLLRESIESLEKYSCPHSIDKFTIFAVGIVDETEKPDIWEINEKGELKQVIRSLGKTPFDH